MKLKTKITSSEDFEIQAKIMEPLYVSRKWAIESIIEVACQNREDFIHFFIRDSIEPDEEELEYAANPDVPPSRAETIEEISTQTNQPIYAVIRGMVRFFLNGDFTIVDLPTPITNSPTREKSKPVTSQRYQQRFGVDGAIQIDEEEGKRIVKDDIMGLGDEEPDLCSICEEREAGQTGMCQECYEERSKEPTYFRPWRGRRDSDGVDTDLGSNYR